MKLYLYFQLYPISDDLSFNDDELKGLYAWTCLLYTSPSPRD